MMSEPKEKEDEAPGTSEAIVAGIRKRRDRLQRQLASFSFRWRVLAFHSVAGGLVGGIASYIQVPSIRPELALFCAGGVLAGAVLYVIFLLYARTVIHFFLRLQDSMLAGAGIEKLQETLEDDFFTKLVKINFKYIDQYYLQTQSQADKSFTLTAGVAAVAVGIIIAGVVLMFLGKTTPAYVTAASGILGEFIAAVFFYLYNRTITKMGQYHQKLVLTQNVSLAMKIAEGLPPAERVKMQQELIQRLTENVNKYLTEFPDSVDKK
jgi:hypothetical protein